MPCMLLIWIGYQAVRRNPELSSPKRKKKKPMGKESNRLIQLPNLPIDGINSLPNLTEIQHLKTGSMGRRITRMSKISRKDAFDSII